MFFDHVNVPVCPGDCLFWPLRKGNVGGLAGPQSCMPVFILPTSNRMLSVSMIWKLCDSESSVIEQILSDVLMLLPVAVFPSRIVDLNI
jgi:hypothetical protein